MKSPNSTEMVSFYGADGSGKTTIAHAYANEMNARGEDYYVFGGSSYKEWLTPAVAKEFLGSNHRIDKVNDTFETQTLLYEDLAIACYGLAAKIRQDGTNIAIDSDPYLKRIIWSSLENPNPEVRDEYTEKFSNRMLDYLGDGVSLTNVVGVNIESKNTTESELLDRLLKREGNSDHDPTDIDEVRILTGAVKRVWDEMRVANHNNSPLAPFVADAKFISVSNPECKDEQGLVEQTKDVVAEIAKQIR